MMMIDPDIQAAAQLACLFEISAPKPGNVTPTADFGDARFEHYLASAAAIGPALAGAGGRGLGATIRAAVRATRAYAEVNTNLGLILVLAPLAKAAAASRRSPLRDRLGVVLERLSVADAVETYAAIREAQPGGLGTVAEQDVRDEPSVTLREAMALAADRDSIAREYVTDFAITFEMAAPALLAARRSGMGWWDAIVQTYLEVLAAVPDTLIARKSGGSAAEAVSRAAGEVLAAGGVYTEAGRRAVAALDRDLRDHSHNVRNPGTTADLMAAALFVVFREYGEPI